MTGLAGLDRKQMEQERLARLGQKRKRDDSNAKIEDESGIPRKISKLEAITAAVTSDTIDMSYIKDVNTLQFPDGAVKRTWAFGYPRENDDIKIEEVIQKQNLELAILSAFQIDAEWITSKLNPDTRYVQDTWG